MYSITASGLTDISDISSLVTPIFGIGLYIIAAYFMIRTLVLIFVGQIDMAGGRPGALGDIIVQGLYMLIALLLAVNAQSISATVTNAISSHSDVLTTGNIGDLRYIIEPLGGLVIKLAGTLAVSFTLVAVVMNVLKGQLSTMSGSVAGLSESAFQGLATVLVFTIGIVIIVLGSSLI
jgi:hypothetical protein